MVIPAMPLGPFLVEEGGRLALRHPGTEPAFTFLWRNRCFAVKLRTGGIAFAVPIGRLPSTSVGSSKRESAMAFLRALGRALPAGWRLSLLPDHRIQLETNMNLAWPATVAALITPVFAMLMQAAPVLDVMDEAGLA